ncbi:MAG: TonB-dependent receptor [Chitinophagaceae bacterium]|nr:TonB-dependent receptor [Chitinophagaceae bacterium]
MKKFLGTTCMLLLTTLLHAQLSLNGTIKNEQSVPLPNASVTLEAGNFKKMMLTDANGRFQFTNVPASRSGYFLTVMYTGKRIEIVRINESSQSQNIILEDDPYELEPLSVKATRASENAPFAKTNISAAEIRKENLGQDLPFLLNQSPSVVVNSDAGNGVGYTGIRIRGTDATRINVTLNGIPYNDAESQGTYFVDLPDFASSLSSVQIQRGVGTSTNGAGAFGATINLSTNQVHEKAYAESNNSFGSFNTWKNNIIAGSGLMNNHFTIDVRLSRLSSDGYIDRASSNLQSYFLSAAYITGKTSLRFNTFSGKEKTYQAWNGVPEYLLKTNRTYNSSGTDKPGEPYDNETDNYRQTHYQLFFDHQFLSNWSLNLAGFITPGKGYYEEYRAGQHYADYGLPNVISGSTTITKTDLVKQLWLDNKFYGSIFSLQHHTNENNIIFGGGLTQYDGNHFGRIIMGNNIPSGYEWYHLTAIKKDANIYAKWQRHISDHFDFFADMQYRHVSHQMNGFRNNPSLFIKRKFDFVNPKFGLTYHHNNFQAFLSYARAGKEPNRDDFEANLSQQPKAEYLDDFEAGIEQKNGHANFGVTAYFMQYKDQLILTGKINDVGSYTRTNVPNSYRAGIEMQGGYTFSKWLNATGNISFSRNKIKSFVEYFDNYDNGKQETVQHKNTTIAFSPSLTGAATLNILPSGNTEISLLHKYAGRQYLDNTEDKSRSLNAYFLQDARFIYHVNQNIFAGADVMLQVNNIWNKKYEPNGYTFSYIYNGSFTTENYYFPMAGTNYMVGLNLRF